MILTRDELIKEGINEDDYYATVQEHEGEWVTCGVATGGFILENEEFCKDQHYTTIPQEQAWDIMMGL